MCQQWGPPQGNQGGKPPVLGVFIAAALVVVLLMGTGAVKHHPAFQAFGKQGGGPAMAGILGQFLKDSTKMLPKIGGRPGKGNICPVDGKVKFSDTWGASRSGGRRRHKGVDMFAKAGTRLVAIKKARVARAGWNPLGGIGVTLRDGRGTEFYYAHLSSKTVRAGQHVKRGQLIGRVGNTGNARNTASHLHFEVRPHGRPVNPTGYVRAWC